jgi:hypothetical protein
VLLRDLERSILRHDRALEAPLPESAGSSAAAGAETLALETTAAVSWTWNASKLSSVALGGWTLRASTSPYLLTTACAPITLSLARLGSRALSRQQRSLPVGAAASAGIDSFASS